MDERLAAELQRKRPIPGGRFRGELRRSLLELEMRLRRPHHLWVLAAAYACSGAVLLALAALGAAGSGPFA